MASRILRSGRAIRHPRAARACLFSSARFSLRNGARAFQASEHHRRRSAESLALHPGFDRRGEYHQRRAESRRMGNRRDDRGERSLRTGDAPAGYSDGSQRASVEESLVRARRLFAGTRPDCEPVRVGRERGAYADVRARPADGRLTRLASRLQLSVVRRRILRGPVRSRPRARASVCDVRLLLVAVPGIESRATDGRCRIGRVVELEQIRSDNESGQYRVRIRSGLSR